MKKRYDRRMLSAFSAALAEKELAAQFTISKRGLQDLLQMDDWLTRFAALERNSGRYCCADILAAAADTLARLSPVPEAGWLDFCYRFAVDRLYPNSEFAVQRQKYGDGALFLLTLKNVNARHLTGGSILIGWNRQTAVRAAWNIVVFAAVGAAIMFMN